MTAARKQELEDTVAGFFCGIALLCLSALICICFAVLWVPIRICQGMSALLHWRH